MHLGIRDLVGDDNQGEDSVCFESQQRIFETICSESQIGGFDQSMEVVVCHGSLRSTCESRTAD